MQKAHDFDFKPFFDLIVGMLFVLIIMVAAELVFQQYNPTNEAQKQNKAAFEKEVLDYLTEVRQILNKKGLTSTLDVTERSVSLDFSSFNKNSQNTAVLKDFISKALHYHLFTLQNLNIYVAVNDLNGKPANEVGEALLTASMYKEDPSLFSLNNAQEHRLIMINKLNISPNVGILTFKFDLDFKK